MTRRHLAALALLGLALSLVAYVVGSAVLGRREAPPPLETAGHEPVRDGCLQEHGFNLCDQGTATLKSFWLQHRELLGEPLSGFDGHSQTFRYGRLSYAPEHPAGWEVELTNEGLQALLAQGLTPQPEAPLHPAVAAWLVPQTEVGHEATRIVGRVLSPALCDGTTRQCRQYTDKQLFLFAPDTTNVTEIHRAPLGLLGLYPDAETPQAQLEPDVVRWPLVPAGLLALLGLLLLTRRPRGVRTSPYTI